MPVRENWHEQCDDRAFTLGLRDHLCGSYGWYEIHVRYPLQLMEGLASCRLLARAGVISHGLRAACRRYSIVGSWFGT